MSPIPFYKMSGSGNDFILIDNRDAVVPEDELQAFIIGACRRKLSVGADGMILVESSSTADFQWRFFNADGSVAEMCGNGARCVARFAFLTHMVPRKMAFETLAGTINASVDEKTVKIQMTDPQALKSHFALDVAGVAMDVGSVNTGVPHVVAIVEDIETVDVVNTGRLIRNHPDFSPAGTNANFVSVDRTGEIFIRTYERGVEDETLACGTGNVAAALILAENRKRMSPVTLTTRSGSRLTIHFDKCSDGYKHVFLEGDARVIYCGELWEEAWRM